MTLFRVTPAPQHFVFQFSEAHQQVTIGDDPVLILTENFVSRAVPANVDNGFAHLLPANPRHGLPM